MRFVVLGAVTGACFCVLALAVLGAIGGYFNPDGFPPGLLPGVPRVIVGSLGALAYYGLLAGATGALVGSLGGGIMAGVSRMVAKVGR
jgi:hypothetical protein